MYSRVPGFYLRVQGVNLRVPEEISTHGGGREVFTKHKVPTLNNLVVIFSSMKLGKITGFIQSLIKRSETTRLSLETDIIYINICYNWSQQSR